MQLASSSTTAGSRPGQPPEGAGGSARTPQGTDATGAAPGAARDAVEAAKAEVGSGRIGSPPGRTAADASPVSRGRVWRRWLFALLSIALLAFVVSQFTTLSALEADFSGADWRWMAVACALQAVFFLLYGGLYRYGLGAVEVRSGALRLVPVVLASIFAKTVLPLTAAPAAAVFIDDAAARGESGPRTAVAMIVVLVVDLITALPFVVVGAVALVARSTLVAFALVGTGLFVAFILVLVLGLVLAARRPSLLAWVLERLAGATNWLLRSLGRRARVPDEWGRVTAEQLVAGVAAVPRHRREIAIAALFGLGIHVVNLAGLAALFLTFGQPLDPAALAAGFGMGIVFFIISIVPDGIGAVEGAMALVFVALGMEPAAAIVVTIAYRVLNVWIPVALGFVCARYLRLFGGKGIDWPAAPETQGAPAAVGTQRSES